MSTVQTQKVIVPTTTGDKGRPIIEMALKDPKGVWTDYIKFNFDTGASYPTDIPIGVASKWGSITNSDQKYYKDSLVKIKGLDGEYKLEICLQDKDHYDLFKAEPPPIRYPLCRVRDLVKYMSFVYSKENTAIAIGTTQPQELKDAVAAKKIIPRLADMKRRTGTPTTGWQWYHADLMDPVQNMKSEDWFGMNTGDRRAIVKKSTCDKVNLSYPSLGSDGRADTKATILWKEASPPLKMENITIQVRDDDERFARGGEPRNLIGGPCWLDKWKIVLWSPYLHLAFIPRS